MAPGLSLVEPHRLIWKELVCLTKKFLSKPYQPQVSVLSVPCSALKIFMKTVHTIHTNSQIVHVSRALMWWAEHSSAKSLSALLSGCEKGADICTVKLKGYQLCSHPATSDSQLARAWVSLGRSLQRREHAMPLIRRQLSLHMVK